MRANHALYAPNAMQSSTFLALDGFDCVIEQCLSLLGKDEVPGSNPGNSSKMNFREMRFFELL